MLLKAMKKHEKLLHGSSKTKLILGKIVKEIVLKNHYTLPKPIVVVRVCTSKLAGSF